MAFTEQGVAILGSVLNSKSAFQANLQIMRAFTQLQLILAPNATRDLLGVDSIMIGTDYWQD